jgi:hypothetical protein
MKKAICFLTVKPPKNFFEFAKLLKDENYDIFVCIDHNEYIIPDYDNNCINIIRFVDNEPESLGFKNTLRMYKQNKAGSRDKSLYYFCRINTIYDFVWMIEDDVFIPTTETIKDLDIKYQSCDLLCESNTIINDLSKKEIWWGFQDLYDTMPNIPFPWAKSMVCAIRVSKKLLDCINKFVEENKILIGSELIFNTLATQNNLDIITPIELSTIYYQKIFKHEDIKNNYLYHPINNIDTQFLFRRTDLCKTHKIFRKKFVSKHK